MSPRLLKSSPIWSHWSSRDNYLLKASRCNHNPLCDRSEEKLFYSIGSRERWLRLQPAPETFTGGSTTRRRARSEEPAPSWPPGTAAGQTTSMSGRTSFGLFTGLFWPFPVFCHFLLFWPYGPVDFFFGLFNYFWSILSVWSF